MFSADSNVFYDDYFTEYNNMNPTTSSFNPHPRLSLDSGLGLTNDSFYSSDLNETQLMDISAATASDSSISFQSGPLESSPPTKWARVRTPPNRKRMEREEEKKDALPPGLNPFSPPSRKKIKALFSSPTKSMKTPESLRKSIRISSPSPFKVTFSKTPLKLSNSENMTGIHIGRTGTYYNKRVMGSASKRCLLPSKPDGFTLLGSPNSDVLNLPLEKGFKAFGELPTETPNKINAALETGNTMDYDEYTGMIEARSFLSRYTNSSGPLLENPMRNVKSLPIVRSASRNLLKNNKESFAVQPKKQPTCIEQEAPSNPIITEKLKEKNSKKEQLIKSKQQSAKEAMWKETKEKEMKNWKATPFETPKKDVPLYSGRWLVISTGRTPAQQELFSDAKKFFQKHKPSIPTPDVVSSTRRIPTIARLILFKHRYRSFHA